MKTKQELQVMADEVFAKKQKVQKLFGTEDGNIFYTRENAKKYGKGTMHEFERKAEVKTKKVKEPETPAN